jgi:luciferase family oxidoreductase group 1
MAGKLKGEVVAGILDLGRNFCGHTPAARIAATVELARCAEQAGLGCYWLAEHHTPNSAYCAPEVLLPLLAASTETIRVGQAGILLRYYSPLKVAETYLTLEASFPGRIDLGLCRGPGISEPKVGQDLVWGNSIELEEASFDTKVDEVVNLFRRDPHGSERAIWGPFPQTGEIPNIWMLGSSVRSMKQAVRNGLPYGLMLFQRRIVQAGQRMIDAYRQRALNAAYTPNTAIAASVLCTQKQMKPQWDENGIKQEGGAHNITGEPARCAELLLDLASLCQVDTVIAATFSNHFADHLSLIESLAIFAKATRRSQ